jgi:hypothetical protein
MIQKMFFMSGGIKKERKWRLLAATCAAEKGSLI